MALRHRKDLKRVLNVEQVQLGGGGSYRKGWGKIESDWQDREKGRNVSQYVILASSFPSHACLPLMEVRRLGQSPLQTRYPRICLYFKSFNIKVGREGPQLCTWPQGSTSVQTVIKYLEAAGNSGQDLRHSSPWATSPGGEGADGLLLRCPSSPSC